MSTMEREPAAAIDLERLYMDQAGQYDLLTAEQEVELAQAIERGRDAWNLAVDEQRSLSEQESNEFLTGLQARNTFIVSNLRLVMFTTRKYRKNCNSGVDRLEIIQLGNLGLEHAVEKFNWRKGFRFSTYATKWIRQSVGRGVKAQSALPFASNLSKQFHLLEYYENCHEDDATILHDSGWSAEKLDQLRTWKFRTDNVMSLDRNVINGEESSRYALLPDESVEIIDENVDASKTLQTALGIAQEVLTDSDYQVYLAMLEDTNQPGTQLNLARKLGKTANQLIVIKNQVKSVLSHPSTGVAASRDSELSWQAGANCQNTPYEVFFPTRGESSKQAEKFCTDCLARERCAEFAITHSVKFGIWGNTSARYRRKIRETGVLPTVQPPAQH